MPIDFRKLLKNYSGIIYDEEDEFKMDDSGTLIRYRGDSDDVVIPDTVVRIGTSAFEDCHDIISVVIPNSVKYIDDFAFSECYSLREINIPDSVVSIDVCAFFG